MDSLARSHSLIEASWAKANGRADKPLAELAIEQSHNDIIVPLAIHPRGLSLITFDYETTFLIGANGSVIVSEHTQRDAMQLQLIEGKSQDKAHRFRSNAFSETLRIENADGKRGSPILHVNTVKAGFTNYFEGVLNYPCKRVLGQTFYRCLGSLSCREPKRVAAPAEHFVYFWIAFEREEAFAIFDANLSDRCFDARQSREYVLHTTYLISQIADVSIWPFVDLQRRPLLSLSANKQTQACYRTQLKFLWVHGLVMLD